MKYKLFSIAVIVIAASFLGNKHYIDKNYLKEPVFFTHFIEVEAINNLGIHFQFVTNNFDTKNITEVSFPELQNNVLQLEYRDGIDYASSIGKYYTVKLFRVILNVKEGATVPVTTLHQMNVRYSDGSTQKIDFGTLIIKQVSTIDQVLSPSIYPTVDTKQWSHILLLDQDYIYKGTDYLMKPMVDDILMTTVKDYDTTLPISLNKGEVITFSHSIDFRYDDPRRFNIYYIQENIRLQDTKGKEYIMPFYLFNAQQPLITSDEYFTPQMIKEFLQFRGIK